MTPAEQRAQALERRCNDALAASGLSPASSRHRCAAIVDPLVGPRWGWVLATARGDKAPRINLTTFEGPTP